MRHKIVESDGTVRHVPKPHAAFLLQRGRYTWAGNKPGSYLIPVPDHLRPKICRAFQTNELPNYLPPADPTGTKFSLPQSPQWQDAHMQARRSLDVRAGMALAIFRQQMRGQRA